MVSEVALFWLDVTISLHVNTCTIDANLYLRTIVIAGELRLHNVQVAITPPRTIKINVFGVFVVA